MGTVYIDLLVIINLYITFFMLKASGVFLREKISTARILIGSLAGGLSSLVIFLPPLPFLGNAAVKILSGLIIVFIAFGYKNIFEFLKNALVFIIISVCFAGLALMLWLFSAPLGMTYKNGYAYFNISFPVLVITTAASYGLIKLIRHIVDVKSLGNGSYTIEITRGNSSVKLEALADGGNLLTDYFTGLSVIICSEKAAKDIIPESVFEIADLEKTEEPPTGIRLLPYNTISSSGLIPVFKADKIVIKTLDKSGRKSEKTVSALIGVVKDEGKDFKAIFNPKLLL